MSLTIYKVQVNAYFLRRKTQIKIAANNKEREKKYQSI